MMDLDRKNIPITKPQLTAMPVQSTLKRLTLHYTTHCMKQAKDSMSPQTITNSAVGGPHYSAVTDPHYSAVTDPHYDAVNKDSRASPSTGQSTHPTSPAAYDEIKTSTDTYSVPFSPDTGTVPANQTQKGTRAGDRAAMKLEGGKSEKSDTTAGHVYTVVDKKRQEGEKDMTASEKREADLEKSAATAGAVYTVVDKKKEAPPPLPPPYQPGDWDQPTGGRQHLLSSSFDTYLPY